MALLIRPTTTCTSDKRAEEIRQLVAEEGITLRMSIDMILWFEDRGYQVDFATGIAMKVEVAAVTPLGRTINHLLSPAVETVTDADVDALIDEVYGKPGLGVEDSAGLFDHADDYAMGALKAVIDETSLDPAFYEAELQDLRDGMDDTDFFRHGC